MPALAIALAIAGLTPSLSSAAEVETTFVSMVSEQGEHVGGGESRLWGPGDSTVTVSGSVNDEVAIHVAGGLPDSEFTLTFAAPRGEPLEGFSYVRAQKTADRAPGHPGIDVSGEGRSCDTATGKFEIYTINPDLSEIDLVYELHCEGQGPALFGQVHYRSAMWSDSDLLVASSRVNWPTQPVGTDARVVPVAIVNTGLAPVEVTGVAFLDSGYGADPSFRIVDSNCGTLTVGSGCVVHVGFKPTVGGEHRAELRISDTTSSRTHRAGLSGTAIQGHTSWDTHGERDYPVGTTVDRSYTPEDAVITAVGDQRYDYVRFTLSSGKSTWEARFEGTLNQPLEPGATYDGVGRDNLDVSGEGAGCNQSWGRFSVQQATYDSAGTMLTFAATFETYCLGSASAVRGSVAWNAENPAAPVPAAERTPPGPVTALTAGPQGWYPRLTWTDPTDDDWTDTVVRVSPGHTAPQTPQEGTQAYAGTDGGVTLWELPLGQDYSFSVFSRDHAGNTSSPVSVTLEGSTISTAATSPKVTTGQETTLHGRLRDADTGLGLSEARVGVWSRTAVGESYQYLGSVTTQAGGGFTLAQRPPGNRRYKFAYAGSADHSSSARITDLTVHVAPRVSVGAAKIARRGSRWTFNVAVSASQNRTVTLQRYYRGAWHNVATNRLASTGRTSFKVRPGTVGTRYYRAFKPPEAHRVAGKSRTIKMWVR